MHLDVTVLRNFYRNDHLGALATRRLQTAMRGLWPSAAGLTVAGYGYAPPVLRPFKREAKRVMALMPAPQGAAPWPPDDLNISVMVESYAWPVQTGFVDRLILAHALETTERPDRLLEEAWRVLAPEGRLMVLAPNRTGLWARRDGTPFGFGRPYSFGQIDAQLAAHGFGIARHEGVLYFPPSQRRFWLNAGTLVEKAGRRLDAQKFAGVLMVEALKRVTAPRSGLKERATAPIEALAGVIRPARPAGRPQPARVAAPERPKGGSKVAARRRSASHA